MDAHVKEGQLYVLHQKFGKKWKKNWFVLYPSSQNGIARLEFFDSPSVAAGGSLSNEKTRKLDKKIIRLSECISILPAFTENCPKDNMSAFCVETNDKTHVFCAERSLAQDWMGTMCDIAFQGGRGSAVPDPSAGAPYLQMSENLIYSSREEVDDFWVSVQRSEAADRCGLSGNYWLKAESDALTLKEPQNHRTVQVWPYKLLRRYGRDRAMFSFEAGRRCDSGPGNFTFDTKQGNEIFSLVDQAIQSQKARAEESHLSSAPDPETPSSLLRIALPGPGTGTGTGGGGDSSSCSSREADADSGGSKPSSADGVLTCREGTEAGAKAPPGSSVNEQGGVYSEPADSVHSKSLYSEPVDRLHPSPPDLYSYVYDHINMDTSALSLTGPAGRAEHEHIYDEPEGRAKGTSGTHHKPKTGSKLLKPLTAPKPPRATNKDPPNYSNVNNNNNVSGEGPELYSKVSKQKPARSSYSQKEHQRADRRPDIIYDNMGDI
ncbi:unnamed protein product [Knipowitschia caucasica]|uniref:Docking protein 1b n=1 Tax=Knipowitschia caucasica TaxID=637954 RepID=A0AAV2KLV7_KNICA